jgi:hypothetical protein
MKNKKVVIIMITELLVLLTVTSLASAEFWVCFNKGERIDYCNPKVPDRTCSSDMGCQYCISTYNEQGDCFNGGNWMVCMGITPDCSNVIGNHTIDSEPPILTINSPKQDGLYTSRSLLIDFSLNEESDVYYLDNLYGGERWVRVCQDCLSYSHSRSFKEGQNDITFKAIDAIGNEVLINKHFFIDSKKPRILKTMPQRGFTNGIFDIQFQEDNPKSLVLNYGNSANGYSTKTLNITKECYLLNKNKYECNININLSKYNSQYIEYWFELTDIASSSVLSKRYSLQVDTLAPVINNNPHFYEVNGKYVYFNISITEDNFDKILYRDNDARNPRWQTLCSRLKNGICEVKKTFSEGIHNVDIQVNDKAGNSVGINAQIDII